MSVLLERANPHSNWHYEPRVEEALAEIEPLLHDDYLLSRRTIALLLLQRDDEIATLVRAKEGERFEEIERAIRRAESANGQPLTYAITMSRHAAAEAIVADAVSADESRRNRVGDFLGSLTIHPLTGIPILLMILYFGLYQFVGVFGAGVLVGLLEEDLFGGIINPWVTDLVVGVVPWPAIQSLFVGEYGVITLGVTYAIALILPIVGSFFLVFSIIEDSGYLPRLALLIDRVFKAIGLNGRAVIPMVLGLGCDTMATIVTRVLETRRERIIATLLLALAIPCSAQLGVILGILSVNPVALLLWSGVVGLVFLVVGFLAARIMPGERASFYIELPPLRLPHVGNVLAKTYARMEWYFLEVFPIFIAASVLIWIGELTGVFPAVLAALVPVVNWLGLPDDATVVFLFGFFRRDYGAAGLYDLAQTGALSGAQMVVAAVTLTLFVPCVAQFAVMIKERGSRVALAIGAFVFTTAFVVGFLVKTVLEAVGAIL